jgi:hypothetical protein
MRKKNNKKTQNKFDRLDTKSWKEITQNKFKKVKYILMMRMYQYLYEITK